MPSCRAASQIVVPAGTEIAFPSSVRFGMQACPLLLLSAHGGCVIVGRGAAQILRPATTLRVKLVAPLDWRVESARQPDTSVHDAERRVRDEDRQHTLFVRENFRKDPEEVKAYDLILNAARWTVDD